MSRTIRLPRVPPRPWTREGCYIIDAEGAPVDTTGGTSHIMKFILDAVNAYSIEPPTELIIE